MAVKSSQINVTDLDFDAISESMKNYLKGQDKFKDYDFEGSSMSVLIDMLAYTAHISAMNTNIAASELFLDSAQIRKNVVSRAKDLGYIPTSESAATATIDLKMKGVRNADATYPTETEMTIPSGAIFNTVYDGSTYKFVVVNSKKPTRNGDEYLYDNLEIVQGTWLQDQYVFDNQIKNSKFVLSNERVDRNTLKVSVTSDGVTNVYALSTDVSNITTTTKVYYAQENEEGFTEIYFGDGVLGNQLLDGDVITAEYIVVDEYHANGARTFQLESAINGFSNYEIGLVEVASGGDEKEDDDSIKFKATKFYTSQNRLVTLNDYKAKISEYYPNADAVAVWGGEDNDPPEYGKVFVALKPNNADYLSEIEKQQVVNNINALNVLTVRPVIVDPEIVKILVTTTFKYNPNTTNLSVGELETLVESSIVSFDKTNLNNFDSIFRHSRLVNAIDETHPSILSNITNVRLKKATTPKLTQNTGYTINFGNALYNPNVGYNSDNGGIVTTTGFYVQGNSVDVQYFDDDGQGNIRRYKLSGSTRIYQDIEAGTIDYTTGLISINAITFTSVVNADASIEFTVIPSAYDVVAVRGNLIDIPTDEISVTGVIDTIASGESSAGVDYTTTSSSTY